MAHDSIDYRRDDTKSLASELNEIGEKIKLIGSELTVLSICNPEWALSEEDILRADEHYTTIRNKLRDLDSMVEKELRFLKRVTR